MRILLSNDDGVHSPGLVALYEGLKGLGELKVVAPDRDHSGASNALTLNRPLTVEQHPNGFRSVDGTPTDCVHLAVNGLFDTAFDRVVSGINTHANLGDDIIYSGTVAAATEGRHLGLPAIAVSLVNNGHFHYDTAARVVRLLLEYKQALKLGPRSILNVNVPDLPWERLSGFRVTRLGHRERAEGAVPMTCPRGKQRYWIGAAGQGGDAGPGTDFHAVREGYVSITPVHIDMTRHEALSGLREWVDGMDESTGGQP
ncbi:MULTISPECIES: 5'/3'-nucleotidase SurE [Marinobacter]|uniref:5'-nucleotidase SurE n=3 Tax=Marinobacter TaxID=2742 RepID=SURE_MARN8|nr:MULTISPECIES: 5'/3'-nucleotidase SurE [Marinobacter]A1TZ53.1 RecName: Full=5'-nucleotidase SurE; AltName: Full=Nucleoside 5'-monophosphate phosphohydrolase [Marinobacter nauticus VT8]MEC9041260.1 5'/3'-nucleotidase SurE [Pseudomonadota bacterium]ABM18022.1 3'-nucleotidase [Marinobacter nauticus VT8]MAC23149.1 5'-nucleotidase SurE [Marinobacter sp.]MEC9387166.1 5'/3'-nucleotidase SurE [Pseudomonadota bacterium]HAC27175.1 5'-nucleotidase SurE [Marinobacter nauticus]